MQQDNIVNKIYSISLIPLTVNETSALWQTILQCIQSGNNYINVNFYLNSEREPVAVEPSQPNISESPESPDPTSDQNSAELIYIPISPPSPIPFSDDYVNFLKYLNLYSINNISFLIRQPQLLPQLTNQKTQFLTSLQFQPNFHFMLTFSLILISNSQSFVNNSYSPAKLYTSGLISWIIFKEKNQSGTRSSKFSYLFEFLTKHQRRIFRRRI